MTSHRVSTKYANYDMFDTKYLPENTNNKYVLDQSNLQPTFEMDSDSTVYKKQSDLLNIIKSKCLSSIEQEVVPRELDNLRSPQKIMFQTPKTPKNYGDDFSISSEAVKDKAKHSVLFYRLFLASQFTDPQTSQKEIVLGNLSENFLTAINAGRSERTRIFNTAFTTYQKYRLGSDSYIDASCRGSSSDTTANKINPYYLID